MLSRESPGEGFALPVCVQRRALNVERRRRCGYGGIAAGLCGLAAPSSPAARRGLARLRLRLRCARVHLALIRPSSRHEPSLPSHEDPREP